MLNLKTLQPKKALVINTFGIGDVLFTMPFIDNLLANLPDLKISYLANKRVAPLLKEQTKIDKVFIYERDDFVKLSRESKARFFQEAGAMLKTIKQEKFDIAFDFSLNTMMSFLTWHVGIKHRVGFNYKNRSFLLTDKKEFFGFDDKHVVQYYLDFLKDLGLDALVNKMSISLPAADREWAKNFLKENGARPDKPLIGVIPGAGASWGADARYRRWGYEKYADLVDKMIEKFNAQIILMGDKSEQDICSQIIQQRHSGIIQAFGQTTISQLAALLAECGLVVLNDGGPLHVAVSVGTKIVSIFGPVDEHIYGPFGDKDKHLTVAQDIPCRPCYRRFRMTQCDHVSCLKNLTVDEVLRKVEQVL